jgi:exosome complex component RRP40
MDCKLPGDVAIELQPNANVRVGAGLRRNGSTILVVKAGFLHSRIEDDVTYLWLETNAKRYVPRAEDPVVGIVLKRTQDRYIVDVGSAHLAALDALAFDGATKRNKPSLQLGALVYCRVTSAYKDMEPEVSCCSSVAQQRKDWVTGLGIFGELAGGYCVDVSPAFCRQLHSDESPVLLALGKHLPFECAIGLNGKVWVKTSNHIATIALVHCIQRASSMTLEQFQELVDSTLPLLRG